MILRPSWKYNPDITISPHKDFLSNKAAGALTQRGNEAGGALPPVTPPLSPPLAPSLPPVFPQQYHSNTTSLPSSERQAMSPLCPACPLCGRGHYEPRLGALLDTVVLLIDVANDLKMGIEAVAFPQLEPTPDEREEEQP